MEKNYNYKNLLVSHDNNRLLVLINRPQKMNALNKETLRELENVIQNIIEDDNIYGAILSGVGEKSFMAGADIAEFRGLDASEGRLFGQYGQKVYAMIERCPKPVIAAVNGYALGGGCELAMACTLRIASINARFGLPEVKLGIIPGYGGTQRLVQQIGRTKALELMLTGRHIEATEAMNLGLVNYVTEQKSLLTEANKLMDVVLANSPVSIANIISAVNGYFDQDKDGFVAEIDAFENCFKHNDFEEGVNAFLSKRAPDFRIKKHQVTN